MKCPEFGYQSVIGNRCYPPLNHSCSVGSSNKAHSRHTSRGSFSTRLRLGEGNSEQNGISGINDRPPDSSASFAKENENKPKTGRHLMGDLGWVRLELDAVNLALEAPGE